MPARPAAVDAPQTCELGTGSLLHIETRRSRETVRGPSAARSSSSSVGGRRRVAAYRRASQFAAGLSRTHCLLVPTASSFIDRLWANVQTHASRHRANVWGAPWATFAAVHRSNYALQPSPSGAWRDPQNPPLCLRETPKSRRQKKTCANGLQAGGPAARPSLIIALSIPWALRGSCSCQAGVLPSAPTRASVPKPGVAVILGGRRPVTPR
jgi:hypothetical protein